MDFDAFIDELIKIAAGVEGHTMLTNQVASGMGLGQGGKRVLTEYGARIADAGAARQGVMATKAQQLLEQGGRLNKLKAKALNTGASLGSAADWTVRYPRNPLAQARHAFGEAGASGARSTLPEARQIIRQGRADAARNLALGALEYNPAAKQRMLVQALGHAGESAHVAQDIPFHTVRGTLGHQQALRAGSLSARAAEAVGKVIPGISPMLITGSGHKAEGLFREGGELASHLDDAERITRREMTAAAKHGRKIRIQAIQLLREQHGVPTQQAVAAVDDMLRTNPTALNEMVAKGAYRAKTFLPSLKAGARRLFLHH